MFSTGLDNNPGLKRRLEKTTYTYDENNPNFVNNNEHNLFFLMHQANYFNDLLMVRGYVFLNEVLNALDIKPTMVGQLAGWTKGGGSFIEIKVVQSRYVGLNIKEYFLEIKHDGLIIDVLED